MVPDKIINMTISNIESYLIYKNSFYTGTYDIIILSASSNGPCAYFNICKFNSEELIFTEKHAIITMLIYYGKLTKHLKYLSIIILIHIMS